jgi:hypothetical protein
VLSGVENGRVGGVFPLLPIKFADKKKPDREIIFPSGFIKI